VHGGGHGGSLLRGAKFAVKAKNVLFCLKNVRLAKEPDHNWLVSFEKNDIANRREDNHEGQMPSGTRGVVAKQWAALSR
jgi:hypothetical protein